jgi:succinate dehydrogenase/fumarate reductase cytochrome b subunit
MYLAYLLVAAVAITPAYAYAQGLEDYLENFALFIDGVLIPFLFGIAFLVFVVNAVRFFVLQSSNENGREKARNLMMYSILAFVFLIVFWGLINLLTSSLGLDGCDAPVSDYEQYNFTDPMQPGC